MKRSTKLWVLLAAFLIALGMILFSFAMQKNSWDFTKLGTKSFVTQSYEIREDFHSVSLHTDTADITFSPSEDGKCKVICLEEEKIQYLVKVMDDTLTIKPLDRRNWYDLIEISFASPKITVFLPEDAYKSIRVWEETGDILLENITAESLDLSTSTGDITVSDVICKNDARIHVSTGKTDLTDLQCKNLNSEGDTGDITINSVIATEKCSIERDTGDIKLINSDAGEFSLETDTGSITGTILSEKIFLAESDTGFIDVPKSTTGGICKVETDTGNIKLEIK